ncbi:MAG: hypothetical protein E2O49_01620 [Gammaproteobacteria bacterium]|nr:MAG: hypothetical protein E2O49_01620 [Gammaproteobacteria bacterium]
MLCSTKPIAIPCGGLALVFLIRELDYFLDTIVADNVWQILIAVVGSLAVARTDSLVRWWCDLVRFCALRRSRTVLDVDRG